MESSKRFSPGPPKVLPNVSPDNFGGLAQVSLWPWGDFYLDQDQATKNGFARASLWGDWSFLYYPFVQVKQVARASWFMNQKSIQSCQVSSCVVLLGYWQKMLPMPWRARQLSIDPREVIWALIGVIIAMCICPFLTDPFWVQLASVAESWAAWLSFKSPCFDASATTSYLLCRKTSYKDNVSPFPHDLQLCR